jgi:hypothetical protein
MRFALVARGKVGQQNFAALDFGVKIAPMKEPDAERGKEDNRAQNRAPQATMTRA